MRFNYIKLPTKDRNFIELPLIPVAFKKEGGCFCLIDSGADYSYLDANIGEALGLDVKSGKIFRSKGITGREFTAYFHKINFIVGGWNFEGNFGFSYELGTPFGILGRDDFFTLFKITFKHPKKIIDIVPFEEN
jgi:hypothetical protein